MTVKVSVVLPNYNYARYLDERMTSLLEQTFQDFELIVVDDASSDDSRSVIARYASDPRVRTLLFDENSGQVYQRWNDGASCATGEYLLFAGADDACAPTLLEHLVSVLDAHPDVGIAHCRSWVIDEAGTRSRLKPGTPRWSTDFVVTGAEEAPLLFERNTIPNASGALLRRSVFEQSGRFDTTFRIAADRMLWARMLLTSRLAYVAKPLNYFRDHGRTARKHFGRDSLLLERYRVLGSMAQAFHIPEDLRERAYDRLARKWIERMANNRSLADFEVDRQIYRVAREVDPSVRRRLFRSSCAHVPRILTRRALRASRRAAAGPSTHR